MNLDGPPENILAEIDRTLKQFEDDRTRLEKEYGFGNHHSEVKTQQVIAGHKK